MGKKFANHISDHNFWITVTLKQHRCRLSWSSYTGIFLSIGNTTVLHNPQFVDCIDGEMKIRRAINRLCSDFLLCRRLESPAFTLLKGQLSVRNSFNSTAKRIQLDLKKEDLLTPFTFHHRKCHLNLPLFCFFCDTPCLLVWFFVCLFVCFCLNSEQFQLFSGFCFFFTAFR